MLSKMKEGGFMHAKSIIYKFIFTAGILLMYLFNIAVTNLWYNLIISVVVTLSLYFVGDLLVLPLGGSIIASIVDGIAASVIIWLMQYVLPGFSIVFRYALNAGIAIGIFEFIFHRYMRREVFRKKKY